MRGRSYFKHGPWFEWRLPGYGADPVTRETGPELFMDEHNIPFKHSRYNVRDELAVDSSYTVVQGTRPYFFKFLNKFSKLDPKDPYDAETIRLSENLKYHKFHDEEYPTDMNQMKQIFNTYLENYEKSVKSKETFSISTKKLYGRQIQSYEPVFLRYYNRAVSLGIFLIIFNFE